MKKLGLQLKKENKAKSQRAVTPWT